MCVRCVCMREGGMCECMFVCEDGGVSEGWGRNE